MKKQIPSGIMDLLLLLKERQIVGHSIAITELLEQRKAGDTDTWATLAFLTGAVRAACAQSSDPNKVHPEIWDAFEALGTEQGRLAALDKLRHEAETENALFDIRRKARSES